jgi:phosphatidate cytidylyltransferase
VQDLPQRTVTAVVYAAIVLVGAFAPPIVTWGLLAVVFGLALGELFMLASNITSKSSAVGIEIARGVVLVGVILFGGGLLAIALLRYGPDPSDGYGLSSSFWFLLAVLPTWAADVCAYLVGSKFGHRKLAPRISPGKTWEGTIAGVVAAALVVAAMGDIAHLPPTIIGVVAATIGPLGVAGDLIESVLKRVAGVKDTGSLLPGHGGVLDRIDSLTLASVPVLWAAMTGWRMG